MPIRKTELDTNKLDAKIYSAKLDVKIYGVKLPARSPSCLRRAQELDAKIYGAEACKLGATTMASS